jgi:membrane associated rhomboid family serine protease
MSDFRFRKFEGLPLVIKNLLIINGLVFLAQYVFGGIADPNKITDLFALHYYKSSYFEPYQIVTHMFMHGGFFHLFFNMFALWMFGSIVENVWGPKRFLIFYMVCGLGAALTQMSSYAWEFRNINLAGLSAENYSLVQSIWRLNATVGASGAIMGVLVAFGYLFPNSQLIIFPIPVPVKAKWAIIGLIALDVFGGIVQVQGDNIAHFAHVGGALIGFLLMLYWNKSNRKTFY